MSYRCVATSLAGFLQQLAVGYVTHGYYFYVTGEIPERKDPAEIDRKLIRQYGIDVSKWTRARRKKGELANLHYLRFERFFVLLASHGEHPFFEAEADQLMDIRKHPLHFMGYSIGCRRGRQDRSLHASVRIHRRLFGELKKQFERTAVHRSAEELERELSGLPFEPYAPVRDQLRIILRAVNRQRKAAGLELVPWTVLRLRRKSRRVFE
jgi:hypothetical protein